MPSSRIARLVGLVAAGVACAALTGCVVAPPVDAYAAGYPAYSTVYDAPVYGPAFVGAAPLVVSPSIGFFGTYGRTYYGRPGGWGRPGWAPPPPPRGFAPGPGPGFRPGPRPGFAPRPGGFRR